MIVTSTEILKKKEVKVYGFIPDTGCKWGGNSCLECLLPECVFDNFKMKKVAKENLDMTIMIGNGVVKILNEKNLNGMVEGEMSFTTMPFPNPNPEPEPEPVPAVNTCFLVKKGRSNYIGCIGLVSNTRLSDNVRGGIEVQLKLPDDNHKWFNLGSLEAVD